MPQLSVPDALHLGFQHHQRGHIAEARQIYREILAAQPDNPDALHLLGVIALQENCFPHAESLIRRAIAHNRQSPVYYFNLASVLFNTGHPTRALEALRHSLQLDPNQPDAWFRLGEALNVHGLPAEALDAFQNAARLRPHDPWPFNAIGIVLRSLNRIPEAEQALLHALRLKPDMYETLTNLGQFYQSLRRFPEALDYTQRAITLAPTDPTLNFNLGLALAELHHVPEAIDAYRKAIELKPDYYQAHNNLGIALRSLDRYDEAIESLQRALHYNPDLPETLANLATILQNLARHGKSLALYRRLLERRPSSALHGTYTFALLFDPLSDAATIRRELATWNDRYARPLERFMQPHTNDRNPNRRLRIGFVSPHLCEHAVTRIMLPVFQNRDRAAFEFFCYSNLLATDQTTDVFRQLSDQWRDVATLTDEQRANQIRDDRIDILVDLALHMADNALLTFAHKPAPVQVTFVGYPGSTGLTTMDYRLSDPYLDPPEHDALYVEKTIHLPHTFWLFNSAGDSIAPNPLPALSTGHITFGSLNAFCKTNDHTNALWAQIMAQVPNSRLHLICPQGAHRQNFLNFFQARGIDPSRITFLLNQPRPQYLQLYHQIDLCLDTLPYNGHCTSLDALWMGVPVVTLVGNTVVGRAGLSLLMNLNLPELITHTPDQFIATTAALARDLPRLQTLRSTLRQRMEQSPLMDAPAFTRGIESAFRTMWTTWCTRPTAP
jgi:predicted O-linked N-acetylglucosamine transferase (SPINDLY family)